MPTEEQTYRENVAEKLDSILTQVRKTNGRVRKHDIIIYCIITAIVVLAADNNPHLAVLVAHFIGL